MPGCGSPFLTWHHFDPPWHDEKHHNVEGMVAVCRDHHPEADQGAFTAEQLRDFKTAGRNRDEPLGARFNWMRQQLLAVIAKSFYFENPIAVQIGSQPIIWFNRDGDGHLLLNIHMPSVNGLPRLRMEDNFWITEGEDEVDLECPPGGHLVDARYPNGDQLTIRFRKDQSAEELDKRYPGSGTPTSETLRSVGGRLPITTVEITLRLRDLGIDFGPQRLDLHTNRFENCWFSNNAVAIQIGQPPPPGIRVENPLGSFIRTEQARRLGL